MNCITLRRLNDRNIRVVPQAWQDRYLEKLWRCKAEMRQRAKQKARASFPVDPEVARMFPQESPGFTAGMNWLGHAIAAAAVERAIDAADSGNETPLLRRQAW